MSKSAYIGRAAITFFLLLLYFLAVLAENQLWANLTSPLAVMYAGYHIWKTSKSASHFKPSWGILIFMCAAWSAADIAWLIANHVFGTDPEGIPAISFLYMSSNVFLTASILVYFFNNIKKWYNVQLILDVLVTAVAAFIVLWQIILIRFDISAMSTYDSIVYASYLISDVLSLTIVFIMYSSSRVKKIGRTTRLIIWSILVFCMTDLSYIFVSFEHIYVPNSLIDFLFAASFALFGIAALNERYKPSMASNPKFHDEHENIGKSKHSLLLLTLPALLYAIGYFPGNSMLILTLVVLAHQALSGYVQGSIANEQLLKKERQMNEDLEVKIQERTKELLQANKVLDELTKKDTSTGLFNRRYFLEQLDKRIEEKAEPFSILYMDLDRFKVINDTHGHEMGDRVLLVITERLSKWKPEAAVLARVGGDEFTLIDSQSTELDYLEGLCTQIKTLLEQPIIVDSYKFYLGISIGVARYPMDATDRFELLKYADIAMYSAKKHFDDSRFAFYNQSQSEKIERRNEIEILLRNVSFDEEFQLYFQPQFHIATGRLVGMEALLRWNSPKLGMISPVEFIPLAEETGIIIRIGNWVTKKAIEQIYDWNTRYNLNLVMGINISPRQIYDVNFTAYINEMLQDYEIPPAWIDLEITESSAMNNSIAMEGIFEALSQLGISISIDDFGTGYSSLSYIKRFHIDRLKIAKELIDSISNDANELLIVKAIVMMAKGMNIATIAEGVESEEQLNLLKLLGCDEVQGYVMDRPLTSEIFEEKYLNLRECQEEVS